MNWKKIIGIVVIVAVVAAVVIRLMMNKETTQQKIYQYDKSKPIAVKVDSIQLENINDGIPFTGTFEPNKETKISAEVQGKINSVMVVLGSQVRKGQPLVQLDNSMLKLQTQTIEVQIEGLQDDVNRYTILKEADAIQGVKLEKAQLGLRSAKVQRATLLEQISKSTIKAPFDGIVTAKFAEEGAFAAPGVPLLQITDIFHLRFTVNVPENQIKLFQKGQISSILADVYPDNSFSGKVTMIGSQANRGNSFPVQFLVTNTKDLEIKSGMFGSVNIKDEKQESGIVIPTSAIVGTESQPQVYKIVEGKAVLKNITTAQKVKNRTVVSSGLKEGDVIVTNGFINLFDGATVNYELSIRNYELAP